MVLCIEITDFFFFYLPISNSLIFPLVHKAIAINPINHVPNFCGFSAVILYLLPYLFTHLFNIGYDYVAQADRQCVVLLSLFYKY